MEPDFITFISTMCPIGSISAILIIVLHSENFISARQQRAGLQHTNNWPDNKWLAAKLAAFGVSYFDLQELQKQCLVSLSLSTLFLPSLLHAPTTLGASM